MTHSLAFKNTGQSLDKAIADGYLSVAADEQAVEVQSTEELAKIDLNKQVDARTRAAYSYLFLLGYLDKKPPSQISDTAKGIKRKQEISKAIKLFQSEAALTENGQLDEDTWQALRELATFEQPIDSSLWFHNKKPLLALERAAYLRLFALGLSDILPSNDSLIKKKRQSRDKNFRDALADFCEIAKLLRLAKEPLEAAPVATTLNVLFDQDSISEKLAQGEDGISIFQPKNAVRRQKSRNVKRVTPFVQNVARVELWLFGYNIEIGNVNADGRFVRKEGKMTLNQGLKQFFQDSSSVPNIKPIEKDRVNGYFFSLIAKLRHEPAQIDSNEIDDTIVNQVLQSKETRTKVQAGIKSFVGRLWDGAKRVWRWFKRCLLKVVEKAKKIAENLITNVSRYIHKSARNIFKFIKNAVYVVTDSMNLLFNSQIKGSDINHLFISHSKDFDLSVFVHQKADLNKVENFSERFLARSEVFQVAGEVVGFIVGFFSKVIKLAGVAGWFAILLALTKARKSIQNIKELSARTEAAVVKLERLKLAG